MRYTVTAWPSAGEPISLESAKRHLRTIVGETDEDADIISPLIAAAREYCENITGRALAEQVIRAYPDAFEREMRLPRPPILRVIEVRYTDSSGNVRVVPPEDYAIDCEDGRIAFLRVPDFVPAALNPIEIEYAAGYQFLPMLMRQAMLLLIGHWYTNREAVATGAVTTIEIDITTRALLRQYKVWWF